MSYVFDAERRVWTRPGVAADYDYSDGDEVEQRLERVIAGASDLAVGSTELAAHIVDWPSLYHLSPRRADLLRPLEHLLTGRVLEVGAGCGAITRFLGEAAREVVAVEGSARRAGIAASRVRDLDNTAVYVDTFSALDVEGAFDAITLIGVLEYSRLYSRGADPVSATLERCRELLRPGGVLVVAIENQHGLKYFAGAPEDHLGQPFAGVEDRYGTDGPVTFGRQELLERVRAAGFSETSLLYPFPDYKHPRAVITEKGLLHADGAVVDVLRACGAPVQAVDYGRSFSEEAAWPSLVGNGLAPALANSFLLVAGLSGPPGAAAPEDVMTVFSSDRRRHLAKQTRIAESDGGRVVTRSRLYPHVATPEAEPYSMVLVDEPLLLGRPYLTDLQSLLNTPGWSPRQVAEWAKPWVDLLDATAGAARTLPLDAVDLTPANIIAEPGGELRPFDLEWVAQEPPLREHVVVRGLWGALTSVRSVAPPADGTSSRIVDLVRDVALLLQVDDEAVRRGLDEEARFQEVVTGRPQEVHRAALAAPGLTVRRPLSAQERTALIEQAQTAFARLAAEQEARAEAAEQARAAHQAAERVQAELRERLRRSEENALELAADRDRVAAALHQVRDELTVIRSSTSWRLAAPVRALGPLRTAVQGPPGRRRSLRSRENWRALGSSLRSNGIAGTVRKLRPQDRPVVDDSTYLQWVSSYDTFTDADRAAAGRLIEGLARKPLIGVVMPVFRPQPQDLERAVGSVLAQIYPHWQLVLVDDASADVGTRSALARVAGSDERITVIELEANRGIAGATNAGLAALDVEYVAFMDHDDELAPHALALMAREVVDHPSAEILYSDEDKIDGDGVRSDPYFKVGYNPELLLAQNYFNHLTVLRSTLVKQLGGLRVGFEGAQDHDLVLRAVAATSPDRIRHVPHVLYHWRQYPGVRSFSRDQMDRAAASARRAIADHLHDEPGFVGVEPHPRAPLWHAVAWRAVGPAPAVTAVIPTRDRVDLLRACVFGLLERTDYADLEVLVLDNDSSDVATLQYLDEIRQHPRVRVVPVPGPFNYSAINNYGAEHVTTPLMLLLNNDIVVREPTWLTRMVALMQRPGVGVVGAKLLYADGSVQHAGVVLGVGGVAGHALKHSGEDDPGYFGRLILTQEVSAVTGACLLTRTGLYRELGGLDAEALKVAFNDVDYCLRVRASGLRILWSAEAELFHLESVSRGAETTPDKVRRFNAEIDVMTARWGGALLEDPAYSPNLTLEHENFGLAFPPRRAWPWRSAAEA